MRTIFNFADPVIVGIAPESRTDPDWNYLIPQLLEHSHELFIHSMLAATAFAGHLLGREVGRDDVSHEQPCGYEECAPGNYKSDPLQFPVRFQL